MNKMTDVPRVTVLMPVYNGEKYLCEAIDSILNQTFTDFEFIIIDDGSIDNTWQIMQNYAVDEPRIILARNMNNIGPSGTRNKGIELARGEYIALMDTDDISLPERLAAQVMFLDNHPAVGVVGTNVQLIDRAGSPVATWHYPTGHAEILWHLFFHTPLANSSVVFRKAVVKRMGGYDENIPHAEDRELWSRLSSVARFANLPEVYLLYREHHSGSVSHRYARLQAHNSAKAAQYLLSRTLGDDVSFKICCNFRTNQFDSVDEAVQAMEIICSLYKVFLSKEPMTKIERRTIRRDAAERLVALIWPWKDEAKMRQEFLVLTFKLEPLLLLSTLKLIAKKWRVYRVTYRAHSNLRRVGGLILPREVRKWVKACKH